MGSHGKGKIIESQVYSLVRAADGYPDILGIGVASLATTADCPSASVELLVAEEPPQKQDIFRYRFTINTEGGRPTKKHNGKIPTVVLNPDEIYQ